MKAEMLATREVRAYKNNARTHTPRQIEEIQSSIKQFGFNNPVLVTDDCEIIAGHGRLLAAMGLGMKKVPVVRLAHLDAIQRKAFALADNRIALNAGWSWPILKKEMQALIDAGFDIDTLGFDKTEFQSLFFEVDDDDDDDDTPTPADPITQHGDVWILGRHRLMCGDSTNAEQVNKLMAGVKANMIFTDPPYGMALETDRSGKKFSSRASSLRPQVKSRKFDTIIGDGDDFKPELITSIFDNFDDCPEIFLFGADYYAELIPERHKGSWVVWDKVTKGSGAVSLGLEKFHGSNFELVWSKAPHRRDMARMLHKGFTNSEPGVTKQHPTQKPVLLAKWFFERYGNPGDKVVDLFGGSGFTLLACEQTERICYTLEISPAYCDVIRARWETLTGQTASLEINNEKGRQEKSRQEKGSIGKKAKGRPIAEEKNQA